MVSTALHAQNASARLGTLFLILLLALVSLVAGNHCRNALVHDRRPLELVSGGCVFHVRTVEDFKQALFVETVTRIYLLENITITEEEWKDFVVPEVRREVLVSPHEKLLREGVQLMINTGGVRARVKVGEGGHLIFERIHSNDMGESRNVNGNTRFIPFLDIDPKAGGAVSFRNVTFKTIKTCSTYGLEGFATNMLGMCKIPDCDITTDHESNTVVVGKAEINNEMTVLQGRYSMYDSILTCGEMDKGAWKTKAVADEDHEVASLVDMVTLMGNLPVNRFIVANITNDIELVDAFFPEDGFVITRQRVLVEGRGPNKRKLLLRGDLGQVFYLIFNGRVELANIEIVAGFCGLREAREFSVEGDHRLPIEEQLKDPVYGSEWGYLIPKEVINSPPTPDSRTTLKNVRVTCKRCGPISFTTYGKALMKSNITNFYDLTPDTDGPPVPDSTSFPVRYYSRENNVVERTSDNTLTFKYLELVSPFDVFATSVALELVNVTIECEQIDQDENRGYREGFIEEQSLPSFSASTPPTLALFVVCVVFALLV